MAEADLVDLVGYCGLACNVCIGACSCKASPEHGDQECFQRKCCIEKGIDGCWQCEAFPCSEGYFATTEWSGLCIACVQCIVEDGLARFVSLAKCNLDPNYGLYRHKSASEVAGTLHGARPGNEGTS